MFIGYFFKFLHLFMWVGWVCCHTFLMILIGKARVPHWGFRMHCLDAAITESVRIFDLRPEITWSEIRFLQDLSSNPLWPSEAKVKKIDCCGMRSEIITSRALTKKPDTTILYLHGGGFCLGSLASYRKPVANLSKVTGARFVLPEYGLAPDVQYPTSLNNLFDLYKHILSRKEVDPKRVFIAGDSAGGGLTMSLMQMIRDAKIQAPIGLILISPWTDLTSNSCVQNEAIWDHKRFGPYNPKNLAMRFAESYLGPNGNAHDTLVSPTYAKFDEFPPVFMVAGAEELLLQDINVLHKKMQENQVKVTYEVEEHMNHVFPILHQDMDPRVDHTLLTIANFVHNTIVQ